MKSYQELKVWQKSIDFVTKIYRLTKSFPSHEKYVLVPQMRRAAIAIPSNIAEGSTRNYTKEFIQFIQVAYSSAAELETQIIISQRLEYLETTIAEKAISEIQEIQKMLKGLSKSLQTKLTTNH